MSAISSFAFSFTKALDRAASAQGRTEGIIKDFSADLQKINSDRAEAEAAVKAEGIRRDPLNQQVYALIYKDDSVIGYLTKDGVGAFINGGVFDIDAMAQASQTAQGRADWIEAKGDGLTVARFGDNAKTPKVKEAAALMNQTAAVWARENLIPTPAPDEERLKLEAQNKRLTTALQRLPSEAETTEVRWQRNIGWFKTDRSA